MFFEPGARDARGEFKRWIYVKDAGAVGWNGMRYPYPLCQDVIDSELILAHYNIHQFFNWPSGWLSFKNDLLYTYQLCGRSEINKRRVLWALAPHSHKFRSFELFKPIPLEIILCICKT